MLAYVHSVSISVPFPLSLHDALPISSPASPVSGPWRCTGTRCTIYRYERRGPGRRLAPAPTAPPDPCPGAMDRRSEEHTSELQSRGQLVCRLLLEKKKQNTNLIHRAR